MSCATAPDALSTRPATTARIVANATAAMTAEERVAAERAGAAAELLREVRRGEVAARTGRLDTLLAHHGARAEADERREDVERADDEHRVDDRPARRLGVGHGEEPHEDVRQARGAEDEREAERHRVDRRAEERARAEAERRLLALVRVRLVEEVDRVPADLD